MRIAIIEGWRPRSLSLDGEGWGEGEFRFQLHSYGTRSSVALGDSRTLPVLLRALDDILPQIRWNAAAGLRKFGPEAEAAVPGLRKRLEDNEPWVRYHASIALWNIARQPPSIPRLLPFLNDDNAGEYTPLALCKLFGEMGPSAKEGIPALRELQRNWNPKVREAAMLALEKVK